MSNPIPGGQPNYFGPQPNYANSPLPRFHLNRHGRLQHVDGIRKFVDSLPGVGPTHQNNLGQYIPVLTPSSTGEYEISCVEFQRQLHSDLGPTTLRGYTPTNDSRVPQSLGPLIIATKDQPVRVRFHNQLPTGSAGQLFLPVDTSVMGAGMGPNGGTEMYTQNRTVIHLHGGVTPWISDGTPHQWITPQGETTSYVQGVSVQPVPDMMPIPVKGDGTTTYYYTNQQSARLMFYHDHSYGLTRLNVYAGMAGAYLLTDPTEEHLIDQQLLPNLGGVYRYGIPLIIQDKTFVPPRDQLVIEDPTWNYKTTSGSLWFPHVYMPNQNPNSECGCNDLGRWDYGPWFWPPVTTSAGLQHGPIIDPNGSGLLVPGTPNPSLVPEAFMDTPLVNGTAYPYLKVKRQAYRFRILNACNDRSLNLQLYYAVPLSLSIVDGGAGYQDEPEVHFHFEHGSYKYTHFKSPEAKAYVKDGKITQIVITDYGKGYRKVPQVRLKGGHPTTPARVVVSMNTEVKMIPASTTTQVPPYYPTMDGRAGGVPDPTQSGPSWIQIGNEGGFLPTPVVLPNTPIGYKYNRRDITVLNVAEKTIFLGPAERADVIIDFSLIPRHVSTLILYNDAPAPVPAFDPRYDYYTHGPDLTASGGAPSTLVGYGPNTRTIMQFRLEKSPRAHPFNLTRLQRAWPTTYVTAQLPPVIPQREYPIPYQSPVNTYSRIEDTQLTFTPYGQSSPITVSMLPKAIQELFELNYGRMNAILGTELPFTNSGNQTTVPLGYIDPPTEFVEDNQIQVWKITHNGVDTHAIHVHLFNLQLINRVGWDGMITPPDPNELGWKETIRMNPLEDTIVALKPVRPVVPFTLLTSQRPLDPAMPLGATWSSFNPLSGGVVTWENVVYNFGAEYVWHCHLLGHEENDMMRPMVFSTNPTLPIATISLVDPVVTITVTLPVPTPIQYEIMTIMPGPTPNSGLITTIVPPVTTANLTLTVTGTFYFVIRAIYPETVSQPIILTITR